MMISSYPPLCTPMMCPTVLFPSPRLLMQAEQFANDEITLYIPPVYICL